MTDDLIRRLRKEDEWTNQKPYFHAHPKCIEAADRIEAQAAEIARLRDELSQIEVDAMEHYNDWMEHGCEPVEATRFAFDLGQYTRAALAGDKP